MATHTHDLVVRTGEYQNNHGETKARYKNVGRVLRNDKGTFIVMDKTFNPAGVPGDGDTIFISMFEPKPRDNQHANSGPSQAPNQGGGMPSEEIPF